MALDTTEATFEQDVLEKSQQMPVLVDFWAEWCGPCRILGPVLDSVEKSAEFNGKFALVKVDTQSQSGLAGRYAISSIPAVKLFHKGQVVDEFVGSLPEQAVADFLRRHIPNEAKQSLLASLEKLQAAGDHHGACELLASQNGALDGMKDAPLFWQTALAALTSTAVIDEGDTELQKKALAVLEKVSIDGTPYSDGRNFIVEQFAPGGREDLARQVLQAARPGGGEQALDALLTFLEEASADDKDVIRKALLAAFTIVGEGDLVKRARRRMSSLLFS